MWRLNISLHQLCFFIIVELAKSAPVYAIQDKDEETHEENYQNPFEKKSEENKTEITDWLILKTELSLETQQSSQDFANIPTVNSTEPSTLTLTLELEAELAENITATINIENERQHQQTHSRLDEAEFSIELEQFTFGIGRLNLPVVQMSNYFITDPLIEFAESKVDTLFVEYQFSDNLQSGLMLFKSKSGAINKPGKVDYAFFINWTAQNSRLKTGLGYISDLSESKQQFLSDVENINQQRIDVMNAYLTYAWCDFEISLETVRALKPFRELDEDKNQPVASNVEIAWYPTTSIQLAIRYETSIELEDAPENQMGLAISYRPFQHLLFTIDFLQANFKTGFIEDENGNVLQNSQTIATQFTVEF